MNNPKIYSDGVTNSIQDSPLRVQNKILGALKNLGGKSTTATQTVASVTSTASVALAANTARSFLTIQNIGIEEVYVKLGGNPVVTGSKSFAFVLKPASSANRGDGGTVSLQSYTGTVNVITASSSSEVAVAEFAA